jgi:hypothetical protein
MSYIFATIGISVINSLKLVGFPVLGVIIFNLIIISTALLLEQFTLNHNTTNHSIVFGDLDLLKTAKKQKMLKELTTLTGREVVRFKITKVDYKQNEAEIDIFYKD